MKLLLSIEVDNDSFVENYNLELRMVLEQAYEKLLNVKPSRREQIFIKDTNGNPIGFGKFEETDEVTN